MKYTDKYGLLRANIQNMIRKDLLPKHTQGYFDLDPQNIKRLLHLTEAQKFKEWSCPICNITVYGPKKLLLEHHKIHSMKREIRDNETFQRSYKLY